MTRVEDPREDELLASEGEYHEAEVAKLLTVMTWLPTAAPEVAVAVTSEG